MANKSKQLGTKAETAVANAATTRGFPLMERRTLKGEHDCGDLTGYPRICSQVKGGHYAWDASDLDIATWLAATEKQRRNAGAEVGVLFVQRKGVGYGNAHRWWAYMWASTLAGGLPSSLPDFPVRMLVEDALAWLVAHRYNESAPGEWIGRAS